MTEERFNQLLNGALHHPMPMFSFMRVVGALRAVVDACGEAGDKALEEACSEYEERDNSYEEGDLQ